MFLEKKSINFVCWYESKRKKSFERFNRKISNSSSVSQVLSNHCRQTVRFYFDTIACSSILEGKGCYAADFRGFERLRKKAALLIYLSVCLVNRISGLFLSLPQFSPIDRDSKKKRVWNVWTKSFTIEMKNQTSRTKIKIKNNNSETNFIWCVDSFNWTKKNWLNSAKVYVQKIA